MRALVVVMLAGCWHDARPPITPTTESSSSSSDNEEPVVRHRRTATISCQSLVPTIESMLAGSPAFQPQLAGIVEAVTTSCTEDTWSTDVIECFIAASDESHINDCTRTFSTAQSEGLQRRLMTVMTMNSQNPPPAP